MTGLKKVEGVRWEVQRRCKETTGLLGFFNTSQEIAQSEGSLAGPNFMPLSYRAWLAVLSCTSRPCIISDRGTSLMCIETTMYNTASVHKYCRLKMENIK